MKVEDIIKDLGLDEGKSLEIRKEKTKKKQRKILLKEFPTIGKIIYRKPIKIEHKIRHKKPRKIIRKGIRDVKTIISRG